VTEDRIAPDLLCPTDRTVECTGPRTVVSFEAATASADLCGPATVQGCTDVSGSGFTRGHHAVTCTAMDAWNNIGTCGFGVTVQDTTPPVISAVTATPSRLWPPDHTLRPVSLRVQASDACDAGVPDPVCRISHIAGNDGATSSDWRITGALTAELRSERGREYTLEVTCTDLEGHSARSAVTVPVRPVRATTASGN
jgi:hypothetical protein